MNALTLTTGVLKMSSHEIAELVDKRHDNVMRDIRLMLIELHGDGGVLSFEDTQVNPQNGQTYPVFMLPKRETMILVSGYSVTLRARIVDRWQELEAQAAQPAFQIPTTLSGALLLAARQAEQIEQQQTQLALAAPKVAFVDQYVDSTGLKGFREVAKLLKANEARFREFLEGKGIMYRLGGVLTAYQQHIDAGRFDFKTGTSQHSNHAYSRCMFTSKGVDWVAGLWAVHQLHAEGCQ